MIPTLNSLRDKKAQNKLGVISASPSANLKQLFSTRALGG